MDKPTEKEVRYLLVREDVLPDGIVKTMDAKRMLEAGQVATIHDAVEQVGLSRSAFYKYKDAVYTLDQHSQSQIVTLTMNLTHKAGVLSQVLQLIAAHGGNVLSIHQSIPLRGVANVVVSVETSAMGQALTALMHDLRNLEGVKKPHLTGQD
jgi:chorismate mutase